MLIERILFYFYLLHLVNLQVQINLHLTNLQNEHEDLSHDCLYVPAVFTNEPNIQQIIPYCMGELASKLKIKNNTLDPTFTFEQLSKLNVTSEQLYSWSAPIDLIEQYQIYRNPTKNPKETNLSTSIYYNCTLPYFGPQCQYVLYAYQSDFSSLEEMIHNYYYYNRYEPTLFTCYVHLECNRGPSPSCLDWTEICDGRIDCVDNGYDEEHCWQLEIHQCNDNEYQCYNGQCIPKSFVDDQPNILDCLDKTDEKSIENYHLGEDNYNKEEPTFRSEDTLCIVAFRTQSMVSRSPTVLTSSCVTERQNLLLDAMFSIKPKEISDECWSAMKCMINMPIDDRSFYSEFCTSTKYMEIISETCLDMIHLPALPIFYGHVYLTYDKNVSLNRGFHQEAPTHICYNHYRLHVSSEDEKIQISDNNTCFFYTHIYNLPTIKADGWSRLYLRMVYILLEKNTTSDYINPAFVNNSMMYKCSNWPKYIPKNHLFNGLHECLHRDDENLDNKTCSIGQNRDYFKCESTDECIPHTLVHNAKCDCEWQEYDHRHYRKHYCDDENPEISYIRNTILFQTACDGYVHLIPKLHDGYYQTDETNCEQWPLIHIYNRCNDFWDLSNGSDEMNCGSKSLLNCPTKEHICISMLMNKLICLSLEKINDSIIDCLGGIDEPTLCRTNLKNNDGQQFYCKKKNVNQCLPTKYICDKLSHCDDNEDERICTSFELSKVSYHDGICIKNFELYGSNTTKVLCRQLTNGNIELKVNFTLDQRLTFIQENQNDENNQIYLHNSTQQTIEYYQPYCHRGLHLQVWLDKSKNLTTDTCLCPPSYYGDQCQYQNQRISLTLQIGVTSDSLQTIFIIMISLIDNSDEKLIHSTEQITYLSTTNCKTKYNIYLLYSTRPKNHSREYFIHIDVYEKLTLQYRASFIKSLNYSFLPVHRLAFLLTISHIPDYLEKCSDDQCINGTCRYYMNDPTNRTFCHCNEGWYGRYCSIQDNDTCLSDALYLGKLVNNRSLCVCPMNQIGPRCLINNTICENNKNKTCMNGGRCIPTDDYDMSKKKFVCICRYGYSGDQCEIPPTKLILNFDKNISLPSSILIHFIEVKLKDDPVRTTTLKTLPIKQQTIIVQWSLPFHLVFVELLNQTLYLALIQTIYNRSSTIETTVHSSHRCLHINELFDENLTNSSLYRRIKSYHSPCQSASLNLSCFYDEVHLCLCQQLDQHLSQQRVANCFRFDHNVNLNCSGSSGCLNDGDCYQENTGDCPRVSVCRCHDCYFGKRCHLDTNGFSLSLDAILSYHIQPNLPLSKQSSIVLVTFIITLIITFLGLINGILSLITFKNKTIRESGCGIYLLCSSIVIFLTMISFLLKYLIFLLSQMRLITHRPFLTFQCHSIDFILRFSLTMDQWLTASVAIERAFVIMRGINFNRKKSSSIAKWVIIGLVLFSILTNVSDPIYRSLFEENDDEDDDEKRIWCIVKYPSPIRVLNTIINILHFIIPFIINIISALIIVIISTRQQVKIHKKQKYNDILKKQMREHKNLLIGPCVLVLLGIPRLIISLTSGCMKSSNEPWLFLLGYFISFIPSLLTFILFVLPSTTYKQEFKKAFSYYRHIFTRQS